MENVYDEMKQKICKQKIYTKCKFLKINDAIVHQGWNKNDSLGLVGEEGGKKSIGIPI
jgi:hypothetical protein